jgi:hypothetical protein
MSRKLGGTQSQSGTAVEIRTFCPCGEQSQDPSVHSSVPVSISSGKVAISYQNNFGLQKSKYLHRDVHIHLMRFYTFQIRTEIIMSSPS